MYRALMLICALLSAPTAVAAQQPCTTDARHVVNELYRHMLERQADTGSAHWVQQLENGRMTVRDVVHGIATSPEYTQRFIRTEAGESTPYERSVARIYRHILGRQPDTGGQRAFARIAQERGPNAVIDRILNSREYNQQFGDWGAPGSGGIRFCAPGNAVSSGAALDGGDRFEFLDTNNNGRIEAREWHGSAAVFDRLDANGDNTLSHAEYHDRAVSEDQTAATTGQSIAVDPRERWTDSGVEVGAGDLILFDVSGTIQLSADENDTAVPVGARRGRRAPRAPLSRQSAGALIARIDEGPAFFVGNRRSIRAPASGRLYLGVNDDHLADNAGEYDVLITIR